MNMTKILLITCALTVSSLALAEGGGDRVFDRAMQSVEVAVEASKPGQPAPKQEVAQDQR